MTGKEWDNYFKTLDRDTKEKIRIALETLDNDPMFRKAYGSDFKTLACIVDFPVNQPY